ncbi:MAG: hypothetical protein M3O91_04855 [Chloroflexota bacterium]|nr:hypothetical protein [Chloroflexota bacterium]
MVFADGSMDERLAALRGWAPGHRDQQATLVVTDAVLTQAALAQLGEGGAFPVRDVAVGIAPDGVHVSAVALAGFLRFPIRATLAPEVRDGRVRFVVTALDTDGLPGPLRGPVNDAVSRAADPGNWRLPLRADDVVLRDGCGVVRGRA